jgi:hypothetical protein
MADTTKLSVEKALEKIRESDQQKSKNSRLDEKTEVLNEENKAHESAEAGSRCPFGSDIRKSARCDKIRMSEPGH